MQNAEIYKHLPREFKLRNNGVAKVSDGRTEEELRTLRYELETFVCEGQYEAGLRRVLQTYLANVGESEQPAAWVSGFFGSGKSHLVKVLRYLWVDYSFADGATARGLADGALSESVKDLLRELTTMGKRQGGLHAASGTLGAGAGDSVRLALLAIVFRSVGLPESYPRARFVMRLLHEELLDGVKEHIAADGGAFDYEIQNLRASSRMAAALMKAGAGWGADEREVRAAIRAEYTEASDVSNDEMLRAMREALALATEQATPENLPCTLIALDEVQQYIGDGVERSMDVQEAVEACCKGLGGRVLFVGTGQNALQAVPLLHRLMGRFTVKVQLSDADVETVTRKTVLAKKNAAVPEVSRALDGARGEIDRHLVGTTLKPQAEDASVEVADYPVLPTRRRFWERVLQSTDTSGTDSQLRNQLQVIDEAVKVTADAPLGTVVGGDFVYKRESLLQSGELPAEIDTRVERLRAEGDRGERDPLDARLSILAWLIGKLPRESGADTGLRATPETMADLLVEDLTTSSAAFRGRVEARLKALEESGDLMRVDNEYRIQTTQSAEWDRAFRSKQAALLNDAPALAAERDDKLRARALKELETIRKIQHGASNMARALELSYGGQAPTSDGKGVPVWIRSGWDVGPDTVRSDAREAGLESPLVFVYLPKRSDDALKKALATAKAAEDTLHTKGVPSEAEGRDARKAMETRLEGARRDLTLALDDVLRGAQVLLAGGSDVSGATLAKAVEAAAHDALQRLFPDFAEADDLRWSKVFEQAKKGATAALEAVDFAGKPGDNPVCTAILGFVGAGKKGAEIRAHFEASPYGWPPDAINGALAVLTLHGQLRASRDGQPVEVKDLDPRGINHVRFQAEDVVLTFPERLAIAGLMQNADSTIGAKPNEVHLHVGEFLRAMRAMAEKAGGDAPLPAVPAPPLLTEVSSLTGNAQLRKLYDARNELNALMSDWGSRAGRVPQRMAAWKRLQRALRHATGLPEAEGVQAEADAVAEQRSLLEEQDPLKGLDTRLFDTLRTALTAARATYQAAFEHERAALESDAAWQSLEAPQQNEILDRYGIGEVPGIDVATPEAILRSLDELPLATWRDRTAALPTRFRNALTDAAREAEPEAPPVRPVRLRSATLRSKADVEAWLAEARDRLLAEVAQGPVVL